jgi:hypothetical protein
VHSLHIRYQERKTGDAFRIFHHGIPSLIHLPAPPHPCSLELSCSSSLPFVCTGIIAILLPNTVGDKFLSAHQAYLYQCPQSSRGPQAMYILVTHFYGCNIPGKVSKPGKIKGPLLSHLQYYIVKFVPFIYTQACLQDITLPLSPGSPPITSIQS